MASGALFESRLGLPLQYRGKVRDVYRVDEQHLLMVACDRLSAFDVVLPTPVPGKGRILTILSNFWFARSRDIVRNHLDLATLTLDQALPDPRERAILDGRAVVVRALNPLPVEAIVRGYLIGSGWKDYQATGGLCGLVLPEGLRLAEALPEPLYTPSTKASLGEHDQNVDFAHTVSLLGEPLASQVREVSLRLYREAASYAAARGIIIADTKFEFGLDEAGELVVMDEMLTPDSSRFWPADGYRPGENPASFDKQYVRDYLETLDWDKRPPAPALPESVLSGTVARYQEALTRLTG